MNALFRFSSFAALILTANAVATCSRFSNAGILGKFYAINSADPNPARYEGSDLFLLFQSLGISGCDETALAIPTVCHI